MICICSLSEWFGLSQVEQSLNGLMKTFKWSDSGRGVKWKDSIEEMMKWLKEQVMQRNLSRCIAFVASHFVAFLHSAFDILRGQSVDDLPPESEVFASWLSETKHDVRLPSRL